MPLDARDVLTRLDAERRHPARDGEVVEVLPAVTRLRAAGGSHHAVVYSALTADTADEAIGGEVRHHAALGVGFEWKAYAHDAPPDLLDRLRRHGFAVGPQEAVLVFELTDTPRRAWGAAADAMHRGPAIRVERVDGPDRLDDFRRVAEAVFGKDRSAVADELARAVRRGSDQHRGYVAYLEDEAVGVGRLYTHADSAFGGLYGGGTVAAHRGRGVYRAVVAARARDATAAGATYLLVDALPTSRPVLERMGFRHVTDTWPCEWTP